MALTHSERVWAYLRDYRSQGLTRRVGTGSAVFHTEERVCKGKGTRGIAMPQVKRDMASILAAIGFLSSSETTINCCRATCVPTEHSGNEF